MPGNTTANELVSQLRDGKALHDEYRRAFDEQYLVVGRLINDWKEYFRIDIPADLSPQQCREFDSKILSLYQEATFYKLSCEARLKSLKGTSNSTFRRNFTALVAEYKQKGLKLPSKDTLEHLANETISDISDAMLHAEIELGVWKDIISSLDNSRKIIEAISISLGVEAKLLRGEYGTA